MYDIQTSAHLISFIIMFTPATPCLPPPILKPSIVMTIEAIAPHPRFPRSAKWLRWECRRDWRSASAGKCRKLGQYHNTTQTSQSRKCQIFGHFGWFWWILLCSAAIRMGNKKGIIALRRNSCFPHIDKYYTLAHKGSYIWHRMSINKSFNPYLRPLASFSWDCRWHRPGGCPGCH